MTPTPGNQRDADIQVISALKRARSNIAKPHRLEHHFVSKNKASLESLRNHAISQSSQVSDILSTGRLFKTYFFDILIDIVPTIDNVSPVTTAMHQLAAEYSCEYDGWGCEVVE